MSFMAKIPSRKFSNTKKKIPSRKFPKTQRKIPSRKFATGTAQVASRQFPKAPVAADVRPDAQIPLGRPTTEEERQVRVVTLAEQMKSVLPASKL